MAEENESQEKTEEPSQRKLEQAKEEGKVLTSKEMYVFTTLTMALLFMIAISLFLKPQITEWSKLFEFDQFSLDQFISIKQFQLSKMRDAYFFVFKVTHSISTVNVQSEDNKKATGDPFSPLPLLPFGPDGVGEVCVHRWRFK